MVTEFFKVFVIMNLASPTLDLPVKIFEERVYDYCGYKQKEVYCMDGFAKEGSESIIVLPPITRNNYPYNGIKQSVLILSEEFVS